MRPVEPQVSVVVPVYNAKPYVRELLDSLVAQDLDGASFEVIAVDDGSNDGSSEILDDYRHRHANFRVIHQEKSGGPGRPRNVGLRSTTAKYVFFADADDIVGAESLRRLVNVAEEHDSDIVIPKLVPLGGRAFPTSVYEKTLRDVDVVTAFRTLFPQKLYRRRLLSDNGIWFPEGKVRWEDGIFNAHAYMHAKRISIAGDYDYYFLRARDDGGNLSREEVDPVSYPKTVAEIGHIVREHLGHSATADQIVLDLYRRKCLHVYQPRRFARYDDATQDAWMAAHRSFAECFVTDAMEHRLDSPFRDRSYFVRRGDKAGLLALKESAAAQGVAATLREAVWTDEGLAVVIDAVIYGTLDLPEQLFCELRRHGEDGGFAFPIVRREQRTEDDGRHAQYEGLFPARSIRDLAAARYDVHVIGMSGPARISARVRWSESAHVPSRRAGLGIHATKRGNVTIKKRVDRPRTLQRVLSIPSRTLQRALHTLFPRTPPGDR